MSSIVAREQMRDWLYVHGIKNPLVLNEAMRTIDKYVTWSCIRRHPELIEEPLLVLPVDEQPHVRKLGKYRGNPDMEITCNSCEETFRAGDNFYRRPDTITGWGLKCRTCVKPGSRFQKKEEADGVPGVQGAGSRELQGSSAENGSRKG